MVDALGKSPLTNGPQENSTRKLNTTSISKSLDIPHICCSTCLFYLRWDFLLTTRMIGKQKCRQKWPRLLAWVLSIFTIATKEMELKEKHCRNNKNGKNIQVLITNYPWLWMGIQHLH